MGREMDLSWDLTGFSKVGGIFGRFRNQAYKFIVVDFQHVEGKKIQ